MNKKVTMIIYSPQSVEFFVPVENGAKAAAEMFGLDLDIQFADSDPVKQNNMIETAIANKVDAIAVSIPDDNAFDDSICKAVQAGIPVVSFNVDDSKGAVWQLPFRFHGPGFRFHWLSHRPAHDQRSWNKIGRPGVSAGGSSGSCVRHAAF